MRAGDKTSEKACRFGEAERSNREVNDDEEAPEIEILASLCCRILNKAAARIHPYQQIEQLLMRPAHFSFERQWDRNMVPVARFASPCLHHGKLRLACQMQSSNSDGLALSFGRVVDWLHREG